MPKSIEVELIDTHDGKTIHKVGIEISKYGIEITPVGYGSAVMNDGMGSPLYFEIHESVPKLYAWGDINQEDPTHVIDLSGASEKLRKEE